MYIFVCLCVFSMRDYSRALGVLILGILTKVYIYCVYIINSWNLLCPLNIRKLTLHILLTE